MNTFHNLARGVCWDDEGRVLVAFNLEGKHHFLPGGHIEIGEGAKEALAREMVEETGELVNVGDLIGVIEHSFNYKGEIKHEYNFVFIMALHDPEHIVVSREDHLQFDWKTIDELKSIRFLPTAMIELLEKAQEGTSSYFDSSLEAN